MAFKFQIGTIEREYTLYRTHAPKAYDGFGTITIDEFKGERYVAIDAPHIQWQTMRYASGMFHATEIKHTDQMAQDILIKRLTQDTEDAD